jgi:hypothetical protein
MPEQAEGGQHARYSIPQTLLDMLLITVIASPEASGPRMGLAASTSIVTSVTRSDQ